MQVPTVPGEGLACEVSFLVTQLSKHGGNPQSYFLDLALGHLVHESQTIGLLTE